MSSLSRRTLIQSAALGGFAAALNVLGPGSPKLEAQAPSAPAPQWDSVYGTTLSPAMGYAYAVSQNGMPIDGKAVGLARAAAETTNPNQPWTLDTLCNVVSVSKAITGVGLMLLVTQQGAELLDQPFWPTLTASGIAFQARRRAGSRRSRFASFSLI